MVKQYQKGGAAGALTIIAILIVSTIPLNLEPGDIRLPDLDPSNVWADRNQVRQGETVTIYLSDLILSDKVGIYFFVFDFKDDSGIFVIDRTIEDDSSLDHRFNNVGFFQVSVVALRGNLSRVFTVPIEVLPDTIDFSISANVNNPVENQVITFTAKKENNLYSTVNSIVWEFGDGTQQIIKDFAVDHSYNNTGDYTVKARIYTNDSLVYTEFMDISVGNRIPGVSISSATTARENEEMQFTAIVDDSISDIASLRYVWDFGDNMFASGKSVTHRYYRDGIYDLILQVYDDDGAMGLSSRLVTVSNTVPTISLENEILAFYEGETAITTAIVGETINDFTDLEFSWNADADGTQASIPMLDNGVYNFAVNVTDDDGAVGSAQTDDINVVNVAPIMSLMDAYSEYNITFTIYGTVGTEVNMTYYYNDVAVLNSSITSFSLNVNEKNSTSFNGLIQRLDQYADVLFYVNNKTSIYDNTLTTTFSFTDAANITLVNNCSSQDPCSSITWRDSISPIDRGFPLTMDFEYFDPGDDSLTLGVDFGSQSYSSFIPSAGSANYGTISINGQLPSGTSVNQISYWIEDDDGGREEYALSLKQASTMDLPSGYLNTTAWRRSGNLITHFAPGAFISLSGGGYNQSSVDDEFFEGSPQTFYADPAYADPAGLRYEWRLGDGSPLVFGKNPTHVYQYSGTYLVWVVISDGTYSSVAYQWMSVINQIQAIDPMIVGNLVEGENISFKISGLVDEVMYTSSYNFVWDFGDGRYEYGLEVDHTYQEAGNYQFRLLMINEHFAVDEFSFTLPINASSPYVNAPLLANIEVLEGNNVNLAPAVADSAKDSINLDYLWKINGTSYQNASLSLLLEPGLYRSNLVVTDLDGMEFIWDFNITVLRAPMEITLQDYKVYGRTIGTSINVFGYLSPTVFTRSTYQAESTTSFKLYAKNGSILDEGTGLFIDNYGFSLNVSLDTIYDANLLKDFSDTEQKVSELLRNQPNIVSGDYRLSISFDGKSIVNTYQFIKITADQDGDLLTDELEVVLNSRYDNVILDPLLEDTNNNGISDPVEFLLADDEDDDGLPGILEEDMGTSPTNPDSDGDGLPDGWGKNGIGEMAAGSDPLDSDTDDDGLSDGFEVIGWDITVYLSGNVVNVNHVTSSPTNNDTDGDGMSDYFESSLLTDPRNIDTDGDGLLDGEEQDRITIPYRFDSDGDGLSDFVETSEVFTSFWEDEEGDIIEQTFFTDPLSVDTDGDGLSDWEETMIYGSVATNPDTDQDNLSDSDEIGNGTSIIKADTDGDGLVDGVELSGFEIPQIIITGGEYDEDGVVLSDPTKTNTTIFVTTNPLLADTDGDGLTDYEELMGNSTAISNPTKADSDGDGMQDAFDPYPLISDFAPPGLITNVNGKTGISLFYKVGENSLVGNVKKTLTATASAIWGIMKSGGNLIVDLVNSIFYLKCIVKVFKKCVAKVPWVRSASEIASKAKAAITKFVSASEARLKQIFSAYSSLGNTISKTFGFTGFSFSLNKNKLLSDPRNAISISGSLKLFATTSTRFVKNLVDPTVNVKFTVEDDNIIDKIDIYQNSKFVKTINVNAKTYNFNQDFAIITDDAGSMSTTFKFMIYDLAGNVKVIERSDSVTNFITKIVNQVVSSVKAVINKIVDWATNIVKVVVDAVVTAALIVAELAVAIYNKVKDFILNAIPNLFKTFIIDTIGKYLIEKFDDSQSLISRMSTEYQRTRPDAVSAIDNGIAAIGFVDVINDTVNNVEGFFDQFLPSLDADVIVEKISGGTAFLNLDFLDGTIIEYVITFLKDGFMKLLQQIIQDLINKLVSSLIVQYFKPLIDLYKQIIGVFSSFGVSLNVGSESGFEVNSVFNIAGMADLILNVLTIAEIIRQPTRLMNPILEQVNGDTLLKIVDVFVIDDPNMLISAFDLIRAFMTPVAMFGLVVYDIINWAGSLFDDQTLMFNANNVGLNALGVPYDINLLNIKTGNLGVDANIDLARQMEVMKLVFKATEIGLDFALNLLVSQDRSDDAKLIHTTVNIDFMFRLVMFVGFSLLDISIDALRGKSFGGDGKFKQNLATMLSDGTGWLFKGIFLGIVNSQCSFIDGSPGNPAAGIAVTLPKSDCGESFWNPTNYDRFANIMDMILTFANMAFAITDFIVDADSRDAASNWVFALKIIGFVLDAVFIPLNYVTSFAHQSKIGNAYVRAAYYGIYIAKGLIKWIADLVDIIAGW